MFFSQENTRQLPQDHDDDSYMDETGANDDTRVNYGASTSTDSGATERKIVSNVANFPKWFKPS